MQLRQEKEINIGFANCWTPSYARYVDDSTPWIPAAKRGCTRILRLLLEHGAFLTEVDVHGRITLCRVTLDDQEETVEATLSEEAVCTADKKGNTVLYLAMRSGSTDSVSMFLNRETSLSAHDYRGRSLLHLSAEVLKGAEVDITDTFGKTPLYYPAARGNAAATKELLQVGAVISTRAVAGRTM